MKTLKKSLLIALVCVIGLGGTAFGSYWSIRNYLASKEATASQAGYKMCSDQVIASVKAGELTIAWKELEDGKEIEKKGTLTKCEANSITE